MAYRVILSDHDLDHKRGIGDAGVFPTQKEAAACIERSKLVYTPPEGVEWLAVPERKVAKVWEKHRSRILSEIEAHMRAVGQAPVAGVFREFRTRGYVSANIREAVLLLVALGKLKLLQGNRRYLRIV